MNLCFFSNKCLFTFYFFPTPYLWANFPYLLHQFGSHFFSIQFEFNLIQLLNLIEFEFNFKNLNSIQFNSIWIQFEVHAISFNISFVWNFILRKWIHVFHQSMSWLSLVVFNNTKPKFIAKYIFRCFVFWIRINWTKLIY
jgi:hypothetical protein